jgi:hypothetical protein
MSTTTLTNAPVRPPKWSPHRSGVTSSDAAAPVSKHTTDGVAATGFRWGMIRVRTNANCTAIQVRVLFLDEQLTTVGDATSCKFVGDPNVTAQTFSATSAPAGTYSFETLGRTFWVQVVSITGASASADIEVACFGQLSGNA